VSSSPRASPKLLLIVHLHANGARKFVARSIVDESYPVRDAQLILVLVHGVFRRSSLLSMDKDFSVDERP
jgi:hypothetical protein